MFGRYFCTHRFSLVSRFKSFTVKLERVITMKGIRYLKEFWQEWGESEEKLSLPQSAEKRRQVVCGIERADDVSMAWVFKRRNDFICGQGIIFWSFKKSSPEVSPKMTWVRDPRPNVSRMFQGDGLTAWMRFPHTVPMQIIAGGILWSQEVFTIWIFGKADGIGVRQFYEVRYSPMRWAGFFADD